jgi:hypothetical protein
MGTELALRLVSEPLAQIVELVGRRDLTQRGKDDRIFPGFMGRVQLMSLLPAFGRVAGNAFFTGRSRPYPLSPETA